MRRASIDIDALIFLGEFMFFDHVISVGFCFFVYVDCKLSGMKLITINNVELLQFDLLQQEGLFHFSTTRNGGVSEDAYATFNLGFYAGDNPENVYGNREILASTMNIPVHNLFVPYQTHSDKVCVIDQEFLNLSDNDKYTRLNGVDALITDRKDISIGVTTADCVPILIYDPQMQVFAAIHAGWKGTEAKIAGKTVQKMIAIYDCRPENLLVGIAPCISQKHFEVGEEVVDAFREAGFPIDEIAYRNPDSRKMHIDLRMANRLVLTDLGVLAQNIESTDLCTYSDSDRFFSARRQTIHSGRMVTGGILR
ncbi:YfiH family protein [Dysgonomonas sp. PFB1-18]|uniref:peptidoglycan editing factor PgeF n=1 Tax=unclassified Dysgonomonas TaxID=2630389 RepID=UPI002475FE4B|nr:MULTISPECIES: peptidoglycan editing factor PgeF [unclassified Dysgonomonas]MDH6310781.1 YfiH family protein [Dysgonomonas sp. PF1-14]MDH6340631.1 YfiH family protein [Dysgonomonas sp. PF1-16]MDH6382262.1 YfiH family protein [Dysgonomonas sp. PFB1-18]MDH6399601.1 YfiH family protein [Dysgonomonas sp. PF1-23]